ncbi:MAG: hypothetical protein HZA34_03280 [Candidatus Pacebacteria bacterium]|nr:hypothetical protein [Candidatus Paceibacterota bacterium]
MSEEKELHQLLREMVMRPFSADTFGVEADMKMVRTIILVSLLFGSTCSAVSLFLIASDLIQLY